jgi:hypothetical protein
MSDGLTYLRTTREGIRRTLPQGIIALTRFIY